MPDIYEVLKKYWGYESFRSVQEKIIHSVMDGKDTLALMPTGGGKSITFQVPTLCMDGMCLVITPLISLMVDQVETLKALGIKAEALHAGLVRHETETRMENAACGAYKFLYVSPERLHTQIFREKLKNMKLSLITVDEAHCISQWGYDFRPSYLEISVLREIKPGIPVLALTATATTEVVSDIQTKLHFNEENVIKTDFYRPNLVYYVRKSEGKLNDLLKIVQSIRGSGIVYVRNRKKTKEIASFLEQQKVSADFYHAGLSHELRADKQSKWTDGKKKVMVATNAFGMGIDKPDVRFVVHIDLPDSPESYFQEAGRGGRDGKKSFAVLLVQNRDKAQAATRIAVSFPEMKLIIRIYEAVSNYLKVPIGAGRGIAYDFNLHDFSATFKFNPLEVFNSLKLLEQQGYIQLTDDLKNPSRIMFIISRDDLYRFQVANYQYDGFVKLILRSYTGVFTEYTPIDEEMLSRRANISRDMVYQYLKLLSNQNIIKYIPSKRTPLIVYLEDRLEPKSVYISRENYLDKKNRFEKRLNAMCDYAFNDNVCRSRQLLMYFGQDNSNDCGM
ncbi:MAG: RecQ family ATP-dependent DNA helicase, partial [Bacteroidales bacterium]|nr:RecQ family ATP-dependent DNA helicase [Bacteroidales bacterium]